jgi:hypothetical protein
VFSGEVFTGTGSAGGGVCWLGVGLRALASDSSKVCTWASAFVGVGLACRFLAALSLGPPLLGRLGLLAQPFFLSLYFDTNFAARESTGLHGSALAPLLPITPISKLF